MSRPVISFPDSLPITAHVDELRAAIATHPAVIVCGETGSGKSTQMPKICLDMGRGTSGLIGHTLPRRIAARSVARRVAEETGSQLGGLVGYKVRFGDQTGPDTRVKIMTDGILLAETRADRALRRYDTLIIDEAHERSLNIDFLLGYVKRLLRKRSDLRLIVTSATIDPDRFRAFFDDAPVVEVSGRTYPVDIRYRAPESTAGEREQAMQTAIGDAVAELDEAGRGDVLVFLSGEREIRETARTLRGRCPRSEIFPLYARLSAADQARVFQPHKGRRIVLATNVAETSLTVPGIRYVIDPGFARISRYSARRRLQRLPVERVSQASADQRAGRCGRLRDGICIRLFEEDDFEKRERFTAPEILRTNLASVILQMRSLGLGELAGFPWLDPPKAAAIREGERTLRELGALDESGKLTEVGRRLARLPVDPRIGRMIIAAGEEGCLSEVLIIASALSIPDPRDRPLEARAQADAAHAAFRHEHSDFMTLVTLWHAFHEQRGILTSSPLRRWCRANFLSHARMREWHDVHRQLKLLSADAKVRTNTTPAHEDAVHKAVLAGLLSNIAQHEERGDYRSAQGGEVRIFPGSGLAKSRPRWIMAAEIVETTRRYARITARIRPEWIEQLAAHLVERTYADPFWEERAGKVMAFERVTLYGLEIVSRRRVPYGHMAPVVAREIFIREALVGGRLRTPPPFLEENLRLAGRVEGLEAKVRRRDLLVGPESRYIYYDERLPLDVRDAKGLARWWRQTERDRPDLMRMTLDDLISSLAIDVSPERFPDRLNIAGVELPLTYLFEPGDPADGVTITVPRAALARLPADRLDWLVPGLLDEKVVALLRGLEKKWRRDLVPIPETAAECARDLAATGGTLVGELADRVRRARGVVVPEMSWTTTRLPEHLRMNVRVVDEQGDVIAEGRDLSALRRELGAGATSEVAVPATSRLEHDGLTDWTCGPLPECVAVDAGGGVTIDGHPALVDQMKAVGVRVFSSAAQASAAHRAGVIRLITLREIDELDAVLEHLPDVERMALLFAPLGSRAELDDALRRLIVARGYVDSRADVRSEEGLIARVDEGRRDLWQTALDVGELVARILDARQEAAGRLDPDPPPSWYDAVDAMRAQVERLIYPGFLTDTPGEWLPHLPRYLAAVARRHEKLSAGGHVRDARDQSVIEPLRAQCEQRLADDKAEGRTDSELIRYRWMLEEYAVSLFAQELGTAVAVSGKKLTRQWEKAKR